jgi:hypothetical protein
VLDPGISFLQKPITPEMLTRKIREVLDAQVPVVEEEVQSSRPRDG